jgi:hypothetical protein
MQVTFSKRIAIISIVVVLATIGIALMLIKFAGPPLTQVVERNSGQEAALAGTEAFYSVNYNDDQDVWTAHLCSVSSQAACSFYQKTVASSVWPKFKTSRTVVTAKAGVPKFVSEDQPATRGGTPMQVWQVAVTLSAPWPQGDGQTSFPAYVVVVREDSRWKFERFLLQEELAKYSRGGK